MFLNCLKKPGRVVAAALGVAGSTTNSRRRETAQALARLVSATKPQYIMRNHTTIDFETPARRHRQFGELVCGVRWPV